MEESDEREGSSVGGVNDVGSTREGRVIGGVSERLLPREWLGLVRVRDEAMVLDTREEDVAGSVEALGRCSE